MHRLARLYYRNTRLLMLTIGLILVAGASSFYVLPRMEDPLLTPRVAMINTLYPGADAERVESLVTEVLEEKLREIEEIKELRSFSRPNVSTITVELLDNVTDSQTVWSRVRDKVGDAAAGLPADALPPVFDDLEVRAYAMIVALTWNSEQPISYAVLRRLAEDLEERAKATSGTEKADLFGEPQEEILVTVRPEQLTARGLSVEQVMQQIRQSDAKVRAGQMRGEQGDLQLEVSGELDTLARLANTPLQFGDRQQSLRLGDIAEIRKHIADPPESIALIGGRRGVALGLLVRNNTRIDHWSEAMRETLESFRAELPSGIELVEVFAQNRYVADRLASLLGNLLLGGLAVMAVIFWLMGWRSALIVGAALPLSALMVVTGLRFLEIPIHQMSVTGLILALGLLIDNAIVMVDDVRERLREADSPLEAVGSSVKALAGPLFGSTLTTALAFAPIALMPGPAGEFVGSIAISVMLAIGSSFLLAMTVIPVLTALTAPSGGAAGSDPQAPPARRSFWRSGYSSAALLPSYRSFLDWLLAHPWRGVALSAAPPLLGFIAAPMLSEQFFPPADRDQVQIEVELPPHASAAASLDAARQVRESVLRHPRVREAHFFIGESSPSFYYNVVPTRRNTPRYAQGMIQLDSPRGSREVIHQLQRQLDAALPQGRVLVRQLEQGPPFQAPIEIRLYGPDLQRLRELGRQVRSLLEETPGVIHTRAEASEALPKFLVDVNEEQARLAGFSHRRIADQLAAALDGAVGGSILEGTELLPVRVRVEQDLRGSLRRIASLDLTPAAASPEAPPSTEYRGVPLTALGDIQLTAETLAAPHFNSRRMNEIQAFVPAGVLPSVVLERYEQRARDFQLPPGYTMEYGGEAAKRDDAVGNLMANVGVLAVLMVATLVLSFNSFRQAALIGAVAFLSVGLGLAAIWLFGYPFGFMAIVGVMGLIGVAINDSIVVLAALGADPEASRNDPAAIREVIVRSTRHVVATSLTTMAGFAPLVIAGGGFWPPLAVAIAGGVGGATLLALLFVPSVYRLGGTALPA